MTHLYVASVAPLKEKTLFDAAYRAASEERKKKTDRYRLEADKRRSLGVELLLRYAMQEAGLPFSYFYDPLGKPRTEGGFISLSHADERVAVAVSDTDVGCDIEAVKPVDPRLAERFFTPREAEDIANSADKDDLFFRYWTLKESFMKATGQGMKLPFSAFAFTLGDPVTVAQEADARSFSFAEFPLEGYRLAVCTAGESDVSFHFADLSTVIKEVSP